MPIIVVPPRHPVSAPSPASHLMSPMNPASPQGLALLPGPTLSPTASGAPYVPRLINHSVSQPILQRAPTLGQTVQLPSGMILFYQIPQPATTPSALVPPPPAVVAPPRTYLSALTVPTQPGFLLASSTPHPTYGAPVAASQQVNQIPSAWPSVLYTLTSNVAPGVVSYYTPAHAAAQPVQPPHQLLYPQYVATPTQTSLVQMVAQPVFQSISAESFLPIQPVPVLALPKLVNDSEREFTDLKMALNYLQNAHAELSEHYKYWILMEQLVMEEARLIALSCCHHAQPNTAAMQKLQRQYGIWTFSSAGPKGNCRHLAFP